MTERLKYLSTELATVSQEEIDAFAATAGINEDDLSGGGGDYLPQLKVNYNEDVTVDGVTKELKKGTFYLTGQDNAIYAKNVTLRPLLQHFQWVHWDDTAKKNINRTVFITNFNEEARDEKGTVKCGKPASKVLKENPELAKQYEDIKCIRTVHALVSYTGVDADGNEGTVENVLAVLRLKGVNFNPFKEEFLDNLPKGSRLWDYSLTLGTTKEKNDPSSANSFYVVHFDADYTKRLTVTADVFDAAKTADAKVKEFNSAVEASYIKSMADRNKSDDAMDALDAALEDIPFETDDA